MERINETGRFQEYLAQYTNLPQKEKESIKKKELEVTESLYIIFPVSKRDWKETYSKNQYCLMGQSEDNMLVGTVMAKKHFDERSMSLETREMNEEEMRQYQIWAEATNSYPRPLVENSDK